MIAQDQPGDAIADARFHALAYAIDEAVVVVDRHNIVRFANPAADALCVAASGSLVGRPFLLLLPALRSGAVSLDLPDGRSLAVMLTLSATIWDGRAGWMATLRPVSRDHQGAEAVETLLGAMRARFLAHVSHELRTPLNSILGFAEAMSAELFGPHASSRYRSYSTSILEAGQRLLGLVNDMIDLSRSDAAELTLNEEVVDLSQIIASVMPEAQATARSQGARLHSEAMEPILLRGDPSKLRRAVMHLLANGLAFTPSGGSVAVRTQRARDGRVLIRVADTGRGFSADELSQAFQAFPRIRTVDRADPQAGLGVGLALVRRFIELHGGAVRIETRQGRGTIVTCMLPRDRVALDVAPRTN